MSVVDTFIPSLKLKLYFCRGSWEHLVLIKGERVRSVRGNISDLDTLSRPESGAALSAATHPQEQSQREMFQLKITNFCLLSTHEGGYTRICAVSKM